LKHLHARNICHRDLSAENVVLDLELNIKVIDFGLAQDCKGGVMVDLPRVGKVPYMSPECWEDNRKYDGRDNDMWSVGVILFFMLFAKLPWELPSNIDCHFKTVYGKKSGMEQLIRKEGLTRRTPCKVLDIFDRMFRPQKARITVSEALEHPYITNNEVFQPYFEDIAPALPDRTLQGQISDLRYSQDLKTPPAIWQDLDLETREDIHEFLRRNDSTAPNTTVYDKRGLEDLCRTFRIELEQAREILAYFFAASRDKVDLEYDLSTRDASFHSDKSSRRWEHSPLNRSPTGRFHRDNPSSIFDFSKEIYPDNCKEVPRIILPFHLEEKYEIEEFSNLEDDFNTPSEVYRTSIQRSTGNHCFNDLSIGSDSPSVKHFSPTLVRFDSLDAIAAYGISPLYDRSVSDDYIRQRCV